jgi:enoyl-CoA hydratase/carnithine racemase
MSTPDIDIRQDGAALHITMARPAKRNALTVPMYAAMADAMVEAERDDSVRAIVFSGAGRAFCAGNDLADFVANPSTDEDRPVFRFIRALANAEKVLIAAVQGRAIGIGTTMLLHCDFVLAEPDAELQMPFVDLALVPEAGSSLLVPNLMGQRRAAELLLLGERIGAERAVELGLVNRIVEAGTALAEAGALAARLATKPAGALRATKRLMKSANSDLHGRIAEENAAFQTQLKTAELRQTVQSFFDARAKPAARAEAAA